MTQVLGTTLPVRFSAGGGTDGILSYPEIEHIIFVDKGPATGTEDGTQQDPFHTLDDAITAAAALTPTIDSQVVIFIYAGLYVEDDLTCTTDFVHFVGEDRDSTIFQETDGNTILLISGTDTVSVENLSFETDVLNLTMLRVDNSVGFRVSNCRLTNSQSGTVNSALITDDSQGLIDRTVVDVGNVAADAIACGTSTAGRDVIVRDCTTLGSLAMSVVDGLVEGCYINGSLGISSDRLSVQGNSIYSILLASDASDLYYILDNYLFSAGTNIDGTSVANISVKNNVMMGNGMSSSVQPIEPVRYLGQSGDKDFYNSFVLLALSVNQADTTVFLLKDETAASAAPTSFAMHVEGNGHQLGNAAARWITLGANDSMDFRNTRLLGRMRINGSQAYLGLLEGTTLDGSIEIGAGGDSATSIVVSGATVIGTATFPYAIEILDADPSIVVRRGARLKGAASNPAIYWNGVTNNNLEMKHSVCWHGSGGANNPFGRDAAQTPTYSSYQCAYNSDPETGAVWTNNIVGAALNRDSIDTNTDY